MPWVIRMQLFSVRFFNGTQEFRRARIARDLECKGILAVNTLAIELGHAKDAQQLRLKI